MREAVAGVGGGTSSAEKAPPRDALLAGRFELRRRLGEGGMGIVHEAFDRSRGELVALKTLDRVDAAGIYRLKSEFRALADLAHPNLVRLHELFSDDERWFFTMHKVEGVPFLEHVRSDAAWAHADTVSSGDRRGPLPALASGVDETLAAPVSGLREDCLRLALAELVEGVSAIHQAGKLHRDLKPSNVLVGKDGRVTILDFGLASPIEKAERSRDLATAGTPAYLAPEQLEGDASPASDWYAVGVMLYEALAGRLPFAGTVGQILVAKQLGSAPPPLGLEAPRDLAELAMAILQRSPGARPSEEQIAAIVGRPSASARAPEAAPPDERPFVGREQELAALAAAYEARAQGPALACVAGLSGMGKSALVGRFLGGLPAEAVVLAGRCHERESVPYKALDAVVDALCRHLGRVGALAAARLTPRYASELCRVFPVLGRVPGFAEAGARAQAAPDEVRRRAFAALKELFARLAEKQPVVVWIDDMQWGDADSAALFAYLTEPPEPPSVMWVVSYRSDEVARSEPLRTVEALAGRRHLSGVRVELAPLSPSEAQQLATALVDDETAARAVADEAAGSPLFIGELALRAKARRERGTGETEPTMSERILARARALEAQAQALLEVVALAGRPVPLRVALAAAGLGGDEAVPVLRAASLLRATGGRDCLETYHDRIRETLVGSIEHGARRAMHRALAEAYEAAGDAPPDVLARHYREAGEPARARVHAIAAAERARDAVAFDRAAELFREALDLVPESEREARRSLQRSLGDALASAGRGPEAADAYEAAALGAPADDALELRRLASNQLVASGHLGRGFALVRHVLRQLGVWVPKSATLALILTVVRLIYLVLRGGAFRERAEASRSAVATRRTDAEWGLYACLQQVETIRSTALASSAALRAFRAGDPRRWAVTGANAALGMVVLSGREGRLASSWFERQAGWAARARDAEAIAVVAAQRAVARFAAGAWSRARAELATAEASLLECGTAAVWPTFTRIFHTWSLFYLGRLSELRACALERLADAKARDNHLAANAASTAFGTAGWLVADDLEGAHREVDEAERRWPTESFQLQHYWLLLARGFIGLYGGQAQAGHRYVAQRWPGLRRSQILQMQVSRQQLLQMRAALALAAACELGPGRAADGLRREARGLAKKLAKVPVKGSAPLASLLFAALEPDRRQHHLEAAIAGFDACDMAAYAAAARARLAGLVEDGAALRAEADAFFEKEGVARPERFVAMLAPGVDAILSKSILGHLDARISF